MCEEDRELFDLTNNATIRFFEKLEAFNGVYTNIHRYLCLVLCTVGVCLNLLHFYVLSRRAMRVFVINALLSAMCVCDVITMASYFVYILRFRIFDSTTHQFVGYSYGWLVFLIAHVTCSIALHTSSLYLSVVMAYIRWTALDRLDAKWINHGALRHIFACTALVVSVISVPTVMVHKIVSVQSVLGLNDTEARANNLQGLYTVDLDQTKFSGCALFRINLWITGIMFKALPCFLLLWFTIALIFKLCEMSEKRKILRGLKNVDGSNCQMVPTADGQLSRARKLNAVSIDRTTLMLIIMLVVFLCTELPQGLLAVLSAIYPTHVHDMIYINVGEVLDLLSLINCLTSFVVYCAMSTTYRATVKAIFNRKRMSRHFNTQLLLHSFNNNINNNNNIINNNHRMLSSRS